MNKNKFIALLVPFLMFITIPVVAANSLNEDIEEIVISATKIAIPLKNVGSSITVISETDIENKESKQALDLLRVVPGLDVYQSGGVGQVASIFIRGAKSEHTLVMIDGILMNDPINTGRSCDLASLTVDNISRIEVLRGPQSTLYGSDAMGGVINIITKKGQGPIESTVAISGGSAEYLSADLNFFGGNSQVNYSFSAGHLQTAGISAASAEYGNTEKDGYQNAFASLRLGITPADLFDITFFARYIDSQTDLDNDGGAGQDDPNFVSKAQRFFFRTQLSLLGINNIWEQKLGFSYGTHDQDINNEKDADHPDSLSKSTFKSQYNKLDWQHNLYLNTFNTLTVGLENMLEKGGSTYYSESSYGPYSSNFDNKTAETASAYIQDQIQIGESFSATIGGRLDKHSNFGSVTTYRIAPSFFSTKTGTHFKATYGTGFKAPSLYQLYSTMYGNTDLKAEESRSWDVGFEQFLFNEKVFFGATYFNNHFSNIIDFENSKYTNIVAAETDGVELFLGFVPFKDLSIKTTVTLMRSKDKTTSEQLLRRAGKKAALDISYNCLKNLNTQLNVAYVGPRVDLVWVGWTPTRITLDEYILVNLALTYDVFQNMKVFGRIDNLFNEQYEEVAGYGTAGVSAYVGTKISL